MSDSSSKTLPNDDVQSWMGLVDANEQVEDEYIVKNLRPSNFKEYIGQESICENLLISCGASQKRGEALDHVLFHGPPGLGKTSLARVLSKELNVGFKSTSGPIVERPGDLAAILTALEPHDILFIDEIHRLPRIVEEVLYPAMEDFEIDILIGQGPAAKTIKINLKPFTLVGATTRSGLLTSPLRDRFGLTYRLEYYSTENLVKVITRSAEILELELEKDAAYEIARRSRGTPRIANRLLKRVRDYADQKADGVASKEVARSALKLLDIDDSGLTKMDRAVLELIIEKFDGGPVGVDTISVALGEERDTVEDFYEPFLIQEGFIARTRRGREATKRAYEHMGFEYKANNQTSIF